MLNISVTVQRTLPLNFCCYIPLKALQQVPDPPGAAGDSVFCRYSMPRHVVLIHADVIWSDNDTAGSPSWCVYQLISGENVSTLWNLCSLDKSLQRLRRRRCHSSGGVKAENECSWLTMNDLTFPALWWCKRLTALHRGPRWQIWTPWWTRAKWRSPRQQAHCTCRSRSDCKRLWCTVGTETHIFPINYQLSLPLFKRENSPIFTGKKVSFSQITRLLY